MDKDIPKDASLIRSHCSILCHCPIISGPIWDLLRCSQWLVSLAANTAPAPIVCVLTIASPASQLSLQLARSITNAVLAKILHLQQVFIHVQSTFFTSVINTMQQSIQQTSPAVTKPTTPSISCPKEMVKHQCCQTSTPSSQPTNNIHTLPAVIGPTIPCLWGPQHSPL